MSVSSASGLPPHLYTDPLIFERERAAVFRSGWVAVARAEALPNPESYLALDLLGDPIVLTRDERGRIAAFSSVCLHRACPIADGRGTAHGGVLRCPYHLWTYDLAGRLRGAPHMDKAVGFDKAAQRLPALAVEEWQGWVFVNADANAKPLGPQLAALDRVLAPFDLPSMRTCVTLEYPSPWNWKVMVENFIESYHVMATHRATLQSTYPAEATFVEPLDGPFTLLENPSVHPSSAPLWVGCVYPSFLFVLSRGARPVVVWYEMRIRRHDYLDLSIHVLGSPEWAQDPVERAEAAKFQRLVHGEDIPVLEGVWRGLHSSFVRPGRLSHLEESTWRFQEHVRGKLGV